MEVYARMWDDANIEIQGDFELDRAVRFTIFHLMSTGSEHDDRVDVYKRQHFRFTGGFLCRL